MFNGMFNPKVSKPTRAVWKLSSKEDKKWNDRGSFIYKGMRGIPIEASVRIEELKIKYGAPPEDLEWGFTLSNSLYFLVKTAELLCKLVNFK